MFFEHERSQNRFFNFDGLWGKFAIHDIDLFDV